MAAIHWCLRKMVSKNKFCDRKYLSDKQDASTVSLVEEPLTVGSVARWIAANGSMNMRGAEILLRKLRALHSDIPKGLHTLIGKLCPLEWSQPLVEYTFTLLLTRGSKGLKNTITPFVQFNFRCVCTRTDSFLLSTGDVSDFATHFWILMTRIQSRLFQRQKEVNKYSQILAW